MFLNFEWTSSVTGPVNWKEEDILSEPAEEDTALKTWLNSSADSGSRYVAGDFNPVQRFDFL